MKSMNLPNKLTVLRVLLIPVFMLLFFAEWLPARFFWALAAFGLAAFTDTLDGRIARKRGLITDFGKLMDPLADKLLVMAAILCLMAEGAVGAVVVVIILAREFLVSAIRQIAAAGGHVLAADNWGKLKTVFQSVWISVDLLYLHLSGSGFAVLGLDLGIIAKPFEVLRLVLLVVAVGLTVYSGLNYCVQNRSLFKDM
jgi:CDP-diacylglycerol--glycerol-3-phosphate 3-phosphatidyltransferase